MRYCTNCNEIVNTKRYYNKVSLLLSCVLGLIIGLAIYLIYYSCRPKLCCSECNNLHCLRPILPRDRETLKQYKMQNREKYSLRYCESCDSILGISEKVSYCPYCGYLQRQYKTINRN